MTGNASDNLDLYMVGDSLISDIRGGNENGFKTVLVKTGNYKEGDAIGTDQPDYIVQDVLEAVETILCLK